MNIRSIILRFTILQVLGCLAAPVLNCQSTEPSNYRVDLPDTIIPLPYHSEKDIRPGFKIRGIKGYAWTPGQYLAEIPTLAAGKANFLMNCYLSMFSPREKPVFKYGTFLDSIENTWWSPLPADRKAEWIKVIKACEENNIDFCFSMNPQLLSDRPLKTDSDGDFELLRKHYEWAQQNGVRWFSLCLDDVDEKMVEVEGRKHALLANRLFEALKANDKDASFAFCPTWYWGTGSDPGHRLYLEALADALDPEIYVFWTGPYVVPVHITTAEALEFRRIIKHKIILWDNYPVNDNHPAIHLGPLTGRDKDLCEVVDGYMSNSMGSQSDINSIPVLTALDYAYNPGEYDPYRSAGQVIAHMTPDRICQQVLAKLVEAYPGSLILADNKSGKGDVSRNPVRDNLMRLLTSGTDAGKIEDYIYKYQLLLKEFRGSFPDACQSGISFLNNDIRWMRGQQHNFNEAYSEAVHRSLSLPSTPSNPRNSEGDFILSKPDGRIVFIYSHFSGGQDDFAGAFLAGRYSDDGGKTWNKEDSIIIPNEGKLNVMSPSLLRLKNNCIAMFYLRKNSDADCRLYMRVSADETLTWSNPVLCINDDGYYVVNNDRVIQLNDGRIIFPAARHNTPEQNRFNSHGTISCYYSDDNGRSWTRSNAALTSSSVILQEPGLVELRDGTLMMFCRTDAGVLYQSFSSDHGKSWSEMMPTCIPSFMSPALIERIPTTGDLLLVWNKKGTDQPDVAGVRSPLCMAVSGDEGITWSHVRTIETLPDHWYCYPSVEFSGNEVLLSYSSGSRKTGNGLQDLQVTHVSVEWLYSSSGEGIIKCPDTTPGRTEGKAEPIVAEIISVERIWDEAPHNAFTSLIRYKGLWYCAFRESTKHVLGTNGKIRVLTSNDGKKWKSAALFEREEIDLRDPSLTIIPDNTLMLHIGASIYKEGKHTGYKPAVAFKENGRKWSDFYDLDFNNTWPWHPFCNGKEIYIVAYGKVPSLYKSRDGKKYERICDFKLEDFANEAAIFQRDNDTLMALIRRDRGNRHALIGKATSPFTEWHWKECEYFVGGPEVIPLPDGRIIAGGRTFIDGEAKTVIGTVTDGGFNPVLVLPSGGDCSYPGMVWYKNHLWISYYSSHEGKAAIYIAKIRINELNQYNKERNSR